MDFGLKLVSMPLLCSLFSNPVLAENLSDLSFNTTANTLITSHALGNVRGAISVNMTAGYSIELEQRVNIDGRIHVSGDIRVRESATALTETKQVSSDNSTGYWGEGNFAIGKDSALEDAEGNIGLNVTAGDHNVQGCGSFRTIPK